MGIGYEVVSAAAAQEAQRRMYRAQQDAMKAQLDAYTKWPQAKPIKPGKCPSCGSRHFRDHNMVRICAYCRSEA